MIHSTACCDSLLGKFIIRHPYRFKKYMTPSTEDNLGRRRYLLERDKAVEESLEKVRRAPNSQWETLSSEERTMLKAVISEIWETCERGHWKQFCFSALTKPDIMRLVFLGNDIKARHHMTDETRGAVEAILLSCSTGDRPQ
jgi:hypothetical protein